MAVIPDQDFAELILLSETLQTSFQVSYNEAIKSRNDYYPRLSTTIRITERGVNFPFKLPTGAIQELKEGQPPAYRDLVGKTVRIELQKFGDAVRIRQLDFESPFHKSMLMDEVNGLGILAGQVSIDRIVKALNDGDTDPFYTMYDDKPLFAPVGDPHDMGGFPYFNLLGTTPLTLDNFNTARTNMQQIPWGPEGRPFPMAGVTWIMIIHPDLKTKADEIINNTMKPVVNWNTENVLQGAAEIIVEEQLTSSADWFLIALLPQVKPFIHIEHATMSNRALVAEIAPDSDAVRHDEYRWSLKLFEETYPTQYWLMSKMLG